MKKIVLIANYRPDVGGISGQVQLLNNNINNEPDFCSDVFSVKGSIFYRLKSFFQLFKVGKKYDVFHIHACSYRGFLPVVIGITVGKLLRKKMIITYHGGDADSYFKKRKKIIRFFLLKSDVNIVLSDFLAGVFQKYNVPYVIIPNILNFDKNQYSKKDNIKPNFISVRSLNKEYNIDCIIKAFQIVVKQIPEASLNILGDGILRSNLEVLVREQQIPNINFIGKVRNTDIYDYLSKADIFLSSPLVDNQPVSILEAYNAGLLVISSNVGGVPYMLEEGKTGLLFKSNDYRNLAEKILFAIGNQEQSKKMILTAYHELEKYSWTAIKEKLLPLY